jgi:hypothetical protein
MELELVLGLKGRLTLASIPFSAGLPNNSNAREYGGTQSVFPKTKLHAASPLIGYNYENARITLVHDCYLREWEWTDKETAAETACFAIIMSPWFSRGWTALELAKSRKVKIVFKGPLIKDLDEILAEAPPGLARDGIVKLRNKSITNVDDLLATLGPRHTSWPRDVAIISGLLVGVKIHSNASQQGIYKSVLQKMKTVNHGHLFHNLPTMSGGFSWCPVSLLDLPLGLKGITPPITKHENVGTWKSV